MASKNVNYIDSGPNARLWVDGDDGKEYEFAVVVAPNGYLRAVKPPEDDLGVDQDSQAQLMLREMFKVDQS